MKKRAYHRTPICEFSPSSLPKSNNDGGRIIFAIDVAKRDMVAAITNGRAEVLATVAWKHPEQTPRLLEVLGELRADAGMIEAAMESSGTYGDTLRRQLQEAGVVVYQVSGKRVNDAKVVYDGVASLHDAKSSAIIAKLHVDGRSAVWEDRSDDERALKAAVSTMDLYQVQYLRLVHQLESWLARHWPEVTELVEVTSATLLAVLARIGGPADVAADPEAARKLMTGMSHRLMAPEKIERVIASATTTVGVPLVHHERPLCQEV